MQTFGCFALSKGRRFVSIVSATCARNRFFTKTLSCSKPERCGVPAQTIHDMRHSHHHFKKPAFAHQALTVYDRPRAQYCATYASMSASIMPGRKRREAGLTGTLSAFKAIRSKLSEPRICECSDAIELKRCRVQKSPDYIQEEWPIVLGSCLEAGRCW